MKKRIINWLFFAAGAACIIYYIICGIAVRFNQSMLWVWPALGAVLLTRFAVVLISIKRNWPLPYPKWAVYAFRGSCALMFVCFFIVECFVVSGCFAKCPEGVDYLILLGAKTGSVTIERRMDIAAEYLMDNPETIVIATGGQGDDEEMSEGEYMRRGLIKRGIAPERILVEAESTSTAQNLEFSRKLIADHHASIAVVSNNYHIFRAMGIARRFFPGEVYGLAMGSNPVTLPHYMTREFFTVVVDALRGNIAF